MDKEIVLIIGGGVISYLLFKYLFLKKDEDNVTLVLTARCASYDKATGSTKVVNCCGQEKINKKLYYQITSKDKKDRTPADKKIFIDKISGFKLYEVSGNTKNSQGCDVSGTSLGTVGYFENKAFPLKTAPNGYVDGISSVVYKIFGE